MKRIIIVLAAMAFVSYSANAQDLLHRLGDRAKNAFENNLGDKVERGVNDAMDGKVGKKKGKKEAAPEEAAPAKADKDDKAGWTCPECGKKGNTGNYCGKCAHPAPWIWDCPECGKKGNTGNFCGTCGHSAP